MLGKNINAIHMDATPDGQRRLQEGTRVKCWSYFPENEGQEAIFGHIVVRCKVRPLALEYENEQIT